VSVPQLPHFTTCPAERHESELRAYDDSLRAAAAVGRGDHVLDIGCGTGRSTRDAARAAAPGRVVGIDVSAQSVERARQLSAAERLDNVAFVYGDAQTHPFARGRHDVAISRFGAMFFSDPGAAFANISRALRPGARLVLLVWQSRERNEWATAIDAALGAQCRGPMPSPTLDAFSLADPAATTAILEAAGFCDVRFDDVRKPIFFGLQTAAALAFVRGFQDTRDALAGLDSVDTTRALTRLRDTLAAHHSAEHGVVFDSRAWLITARTDTERSTR
jgi:SAM-dependent methyltransferase